MSRHSEKLLAKSLLSAARNGERFCLTKLSNLREKTNSNFDQELSKTFLSAAQKNIKNICWTGKRNIKDLCYNAALIKSQGIEADIAFISSWLTLHTTELNHFILFAQKIEELISSAEYENALSEIDTLIENKGWSLWALEIKYFLHGKIYDGESTKELTKVIKSQGKRRIISLISEILGERVDEKYSIDAFIAKWKDSLPRYFQNRKSIEDFVNFRTINQVSDLEAGLAHSLCADFSNSIYDCYSTLIETLASLITEHPRQEHRENIQHATKELLASGIKDHRLSKILNLCGDYSPISCTAISIEKPYQATFKESVILNKFPSESDGKCEFLGFVEKVWTEGSSAHNELAQIIRWGLNLRVLPIGAALLNHGIRVTSNNLHDITAEPWTALVSPKISIEDTFSLPDEDAWKCIGEITYSNTSDDIKEQALSLLKINSEVIENTPPLNLSNISVLWLARVLATAGRLQESESVISIIEERGEPWRRQTQKLRLFILSNQDKVEDALDLALNQIIENPLRALELPLVEIFSDRRWINLKEFDPISTSTVSHFTNTSLHQSNKNIKHICGMACREISKLGGRDYINARWSSANTIEKNKIKIFLHKVWNEENFTLLDFKTSSEARQERLETLRLLVQLDPDDEQIYAAEILEITLLDTVAAGLSHIDESRIFVNEPAIARWAEKELKHDIDRWKDSADQQDLELMATHREQLIEYSEDVSSEEFLEFARTELSEHNKLLLSIIERLEDKFLNDPIDGLNCYLSSRIRHGTFKGTILGPIEEAGLLVTNGEIDQKILILFDSNTETELENIIIPALKELSSNLNTIIADAVKNKIRIQSETHPHGLIFVQHNNQLYGKLFALLVSEYELQIFITFCFAFFWELLQPSLRNIHDYFAREFQEKIHSYFESAIQKISASENTTRHATDTLRKISAQTSQQCITASKWFYTDEKASERVFTLNNAIDIAAKASKNTYRLFNADIDIENSECLELPLTSIGLATIVECLHITFENSWKHSGLGSASYNIAIKTEHDTQNGILILSVSNPLSEKRKAELTPEKLQKLRERFNSKLEPEAVADEGGSGLPKLARLSLKIDRDKYESPLDISVKDSYFTVTNCIPLHKRGDAYDAYNQ